MSVYNDMRNWEEREEAVNNTKMICCRRYKDKHGGCTTDCPLAYLKKHFEFNYNVVSGCRAKDDSVDSVYDFIMREDNK